MIRRIGIELLKAQNAQGNTIYVDALKVLEINPRARFHVDLPSSTFAGKSAQLLFPIAESGGKVGTNVYGILLTCVLEMIKRTASGIKIRNSEKLTIDVIRRLEGVKR